jgi:hypothetical protein
MSGCPEIGIQHTGLAVNANEVEDVGGTAQRVGEEAGRADSSQGAGGEEGDGEELHLERW